MKVTCLHGYFICRQREVGDIARFNTLFGQELTAVDDYYTFAELTEAPNFSILGAPYLDLVATATYAGNPWEVFEQNEFVFDFNQRVLRPLLSVTNVIDTLKLTASEYSQGLIMPGSVTKQGKKVTGYHCNVNIRTFSFYYSEIFYA